MNIRNLIGKKSRSLVTTLGLGLVILIGMLDYEIGPDYSSLLAYLIPVILVTRFAGKTAGVFISLASGTSWLLADIITDPD
jgi:hypothetical protein